ncbi:MAG: glycosyltransferase family 4 protein [Candidatus Zixiibacteriota bacterium]
MGRHQTIRVCHLISGDLWAGAEAQAFNMITALTACDELELSAILLNEGKLAALLRQSGLRVTVIEEAGHGFWAIRGRVVDELTKRPVNIIHSHRYKENILAAMLKKRCRVRGLVQTVHGVTEMFSGVKNLKGQLYDRANRFVTRRYFERIQPVSHDIERQFRGLYNPDRITTIHNAVDPVKIVPSRSSVELRKELQVAPDQPIIGSLGRMVPVKNYELFLQMAGLIHHKRPEVCFVLAGDGPLKDRYMALAQSNGLGETVKFLGFRHDVWDILNGLDLFVMTSHHEGIPVVLLEAMTLKKPCISTAVGGITEVIEPDQSGILTPPGDAEALADACVKLLADTGLRERMGLAARARVQEEFSVDLQRQRLLAVYREVMALA